MSNAMAGELCRALIPEDDASAEELERTLFVLDELDSPQVAFLVGAYKLEGTAKRMFELAVDEALPGARALIEHRWAAVMTRKTREKGDER